VFRVWWLVESDQFAACGDFWFAGDHGWWLEADCGIVRVECLEGGRVTITVYPTRIGRSTGSDTVKQWCRRSTFPWADDPGRTTKLCGSVAVRRTSSSPSWLSAWVIVS
jgi:hypothetical protein